VNVRVVVLIVAVRPGSETERESVTVPVKPKLLRLIVEDFAEPERIVRLVGFAETVKSLAMVKVKGIFRVVPPPEPVTVKV